MTKLKTDSPLSRRIARSFLDFLNSVEAASDVDPEGLEVAKDCLSEVFKIDPILDNQSKPDSLVDIFTSRENFKQSEIKSYLNNEGTSTDAQTCSASNASTKPSQPQGEDWTSGHHTCGLSKDELFGQFFGALEKFHYFNSMPDGQDDQVQLDRAANFLQSAVTELEKSGCQNFNQQNLAETFKLQGNKAMRAKLYYDAIELYTFAVALCEDNAVYYCNRAAAFTQINKYAEAIKDCEKSIEIDPNYSKAYGRLGFALYAQGNYRDAIEKGFKKALLLDPNNDSVKENIRVAEQKLSEEQERSGHDQNSCSSSRQRQQNYRSSGASGGQGVPLQFAFMPFNANGAPADIASVLMNMGENVFQGQHSAGAPSTGDSPDAFSEPGVRIGGNINVNLGEQLREELTGALRSVMGMFTGVAPQANSQDDQTGRSTPR